MIHSGNRYLTLSEMTENAQYIVDYLIPFGWTPNAICGMLGNMQSESSINPSIWESLNPNDPKRGYGLVQWTPSTKYINWCIDRGLNYELMDSGLTRILYEVEVNEQWGNSSTGVRPPFNFDGFTKSLLSPYTLGMLFLVHYERPGDQNQPQRGTQSENWYNLLDFEGGIIIPPVRTKKSKLIYLRNRWF